MNTGTQKAILEQIEKVSRKFEDVGDGVSVYYIGYDQHGAEIARLTGREFEEWMGIKDGAAGAEIVISDLDNRPVWAGSFDDLGEQIETIPAGVLWVFFGGHDWGRVAAHREDLADFADLALEFDDLASWRAGLGRAEDLSLAGWNLAEWVTLAGDLSGLGWENLENHGAELIRYMDDTYTMPEWGPGKLAEIAGRWIRVLNHDDLYYEDAREKYEISDPLQSLIGWDRDFQNKVITAHVAVLVADGTGYELEDGRVLVFDD